MRHVAKFFDTGLHIVPPKAELPTEEHITSNIGRASMNASPDSIDDHGVAMLAHMSAPRRHRDAPDL